MRLITLLSFVLLSFGAIAEKPEWAGKGKPTDEQKAAHTAAMEAKEDADEMEGDAKEKLKEAKAKKEKAEKENMAKAEKTAMKDAEKGKDAAMAKQQAMKDGQKPKGMEKGSEQGQTKKAENSKAWWKFWED